MRIPRQAGSIPLSPLTFGGNMLRFFYLSPRHFAADVAVAAVMLCSISAAYSQSITSPDPTESTTNTPIGRLDFESAKLPEANVEIDLSQDLFTDLFGIGDAAIAGVVESLVKAPNTDDNAQATKMAAQQLEAARQIIQLAGNVVREVHVRAYESLPGGIENAHALYKPFDEQLRAGNWETLARLRKDDEAVRVAVIRRAGSVQGVFVVATDGDSLVLANIVCDISPDNVKELTAAATKIGLENGLAEGIQAKFRPTIVINGAERATIAVPATPPAPPSPPTVPVKQ
jgi:hypothetical protein